MRGKVGLVVAWKGKGLKIDYENRRGAVRLLASLVGGDDVSEVRALDSSSGSGRIGSLSRSSSSFLGVSSSVVVDIYLEGEILDLLVGHGGHSLGDWKGGEKRRESGRERVSFVLRDATMRGLNEERLTVNGSLLLLEGGSEDEIDGLEGSSLGLGVEDPDDGDEESVGDGEDEESSPSDGSDHGRGDLDDEEVEEPERKRGGEASFQESSEEKGGKKEERAHQFAMVETALALVRILRGLSSAG